jgi:surfeit locus 1 family protein
MLIGNYHFQPNWPVGLGRLVFFSGFCALGVWQLQRADDKRGMQADYEQLAASEPLRVDAAQPLSAADHYRPIQVSGRYLPQYQILLDNVRHNGRAGYNVITPLQVDDYPELLLVNRGWVPLGRSRAILPELETPEGPVTLTGMVGLPRSRPIGIGADSPPNPDGGSVWLYLKRETLAQQAGQAISPVLLLLAPDAPTGFARDWPQYDAKVGMHIGYAIQWFVFASAAIVLFLGASLRRNP